MTILTIGENKGHQKKSKEKNMKDLKETILVDDNYLKGLFLNAYRKLIHEYPSKGEDLIIVNDIPLLLWQECDADFRNYFRNSISRFRLHLLLKIRY